MIDRETRIRHTDKLTSFVERLSLKAVSSILHNNPTHKRAIAGAIILIIHTVVITIILWLIIWSRNKTSIALGTLLWMTIMIQHWYFGGCWGVRSERRIWRTKEWYGPWTSLFQLIDLLSYNFKSERPRAHTRSQIHKLIFTSFAMTVLAIGITRFRTHK